MSPGKITKRLDAIQRLKFDNDAKVLGMEINKEEIDNY